MEVQTEQLEDHLISIGVKSNRDKSKYHIFALGKSNAKAFFTGDGWSEDINLRVETDDVAFAFETLQSLLDTEKKREELLMCIIF